MSQHRNKALVSALLLALACARNPVTGKEELSLVSEQQEIDLGKQGAEDVANTVGLVDAPAAQAMVARMGSQLAALSQRPRLPWTFRIADDAAVNAFALPGGYIFVTRGLLTALSTEAELAAVLGHEIGHVAAKHQVEMISRQQLAQTGLAIGGALSPQVARFGGLANVGLNLLFLKNTRDAERQADQLGFDYALAANFDVRQMIPLFQLLDASSPAGGQLPGWLETHPAPQDRIAATEARIQKADGEWSGRVVGRDTYLRAIDGMAYGPNPRQGYFSGDRFLHPDLRFEVALPAKWQHQNQPQAVVAVSPSQDAAVQLGVSAESTPEAAAKAFFSGQGIRQTSANPVPVNGLSAAGGQFTAQGQQQQTLEGVATFVAYEGHVFGLLGYAPAGRFGAQETAFRQFIGSFKPLTDPKALAVQPARVSIMALPERMTLEQFQSKNPSTLPLAQLALVNGVKPGDELPAGILLKKITGAPPAQQ